jgi:hypothetical protein
MGMGRLVRDVPFGNPMRRIDIEWQTALFRPRCHAIQGRNRDAREW